MRLKLTLAYDGSAFRGWQSQSGGGTVQDVLAAALTSLAGGHPISVHGSGRTDAGVHALGQVAHTEVPDTRGEAGFWLSALNATLPSSLRVLSCVKSARDFHARLGATGKTYDYLLWTGSVLPPLEVGRCWHVGPPPVLSQLRRAAALLEGQHDFQGFTAKRARMVRNTRRHLRKVTVTEEGSLIRLRFEGDGFLYRMVRMLAAAMVRVAQERSTLTALRQRLACRDEDFPRQVAPPEGLYLMHVSYAKRELSD